MLLELGPYPGFALSSEQVEGCHDIREIRDEFSVKVCKSREGPDSFDGGRGFPFSYGLKLLFIHPNLPLSNDHAQELHVEGIKYAFGEFNRQSMFLESLEYMSSLLMMEVHVVFGVDAKVIHIDL